MKNTSHILNDINEYLVFVSQVKNLSENTTKSYKRDLKKLYLFLEKLNVTNYSDIKEEICSAWIGDLYSQNNKPKSIQRHLSSAKGFFRFLKKNNLEKGLLDLEVKRAWHELMENGVSNYTTDVSLKNKTLYIKLSSPALKEELSYGKEKLMKLINERFKKKIVQKIVLN